MANKKQYSVEAMCRVLEVAPSGYYAWLKNPISERDQEDARLLRLIRASFDPSQGVYGAPRVFVDLREAGETCSKHRVERLMRENGLRARGGFHIRRVVAGKPAVSIPNLLQRQFAVSQPDKAWLGDGYHLHPHLGGLALSGCGHRSVFAQGGRLGHERQHSA